MVQFGRRHSDFAFLLFRDGRLQDALADEDERRGGVALGAVNGGAKVDDALKGKLVLNASGGAEGHGVGTQAQFALGGNGGVAILVFETTGSPR